MIFRELTREKGVVKMWTALTTSGNYYCLNNKCSRATAIKGVLKREIKSKKGAHYEGWVFFWVEETKRVFGLCKWNSAQLTEKSIRGEMSFRPAVFREFFFVLFVFFVFILLWSGRKLRVCKRTTFYEVYIFFISQKMYTLLIMEFFLEKFKNIFWVINQFYIHIICK